MDRLSGADSFVLYGESGNNYMHVATLALYDPSTAPGGKVRFKDILASFEQRLDASKVFRRRLATVRWGIDRPYWVDVPDLDLEFHVRHIALPQPGDWRQLMIQVARLHSRPLDRSRPLWEAYVIEGLDNIADLPRGSFAIFTKLHHASVDGVAALEVIRRLHGEAAPAGRRSRPAEEALSTGETVLQAATHGVARLRSAASFSAAAARRVSGLLRDEATQALTAGMRGATRTLPTPRLARAPVTRFNRPISANRVLESVGLPLDSIKRIRARCEGATVNDVLLAVCGGALRRYLGAKNDLPERSLAALMPISLRRDTDSAERDGNQVGGVPVRLCTDVADPLDRVAAIRDAVHEARRQAGMLGTDRPLETAEFLPHFVADLFVRNVLVTQLNTAVSNVRGPEEPMHFAGARMLRLYPVSIVTDYVGLNHTAVSYDGTLWIGIVSCRDMLPDPAFYAECMRASFDELVAAAAKAPAARQVGRNSAGTARPRPTTPLKRESRANSRLRSRRAAQ